MDRAAEKRALRRGVRAAGRPPVGERERAGAALVEVVADRAPFRSARQVALFAALPDEIPTRALFERVVASGRRCLFPRSAPDGSLEFACVAAWQDLTRGDHGVLEPAPGAAGERLSDADLMFVPGLAFDREGGRLGRGRGTYDRALAGLRHRMPFLCGLAYAFQIVDRVPMDRHDIRVDAVATESGWLGTERRAEG